jgi:hypothetical protein
MTWKGREATEVIAWFQYECDPSLNSNVFQVASYVVQKHFPGKTVSFVMPRYCSGNESRTQSCYRERSPIEIIQVNIVAFHNRLGELDLHSYFNVD